MYFKCEIGSETGLKFNNLYETGKVLRAECLKLAHKYGFRNYGRPDTIAFGGIECFNNPYDDTEDLHIYKVQNGFYFPKRKTSKGKQILEEMKFIGCISRYDFYKVIGIDSVFELIGFDTNKECTLFGFTVGGDWDFVPPKDFIEITGSEYIQLFKGKQA